MPRSSESVAALASALAKAQAELINPEQSAALRDRLLAEIGNIASAELAANWAREALAAKNKLAAPDAKLVEDIFEQRLSELASAGTNPLNNDALAIDDAGPQETGLTASADRRFGSLQFPIARA